MSVTIDSNGVQLIGDGFGRNAARHQLTAAPAGTVKIQLAFRAWLDAFSAFGEDTAAGWDHCDFFGLGFDDTIFDFASLPLDLPNFLGWANPWPTNANSGGTGTVYPNRKIISYYWVGGANVWAALGGTSTVIQPVKLYDGNGAVLDTETGFSSNSQRASLLSLPANPTVGAMVTFLWEVWGSSSDKSVFLRLIRDTDSVAEGDGMFDIASGKIVGSTLGQIYQRTIHGDTTSLWRNSDGTMNFPRWLKLKYTWPSQTLRLKYFKVRYLNAVDTVIGEG